MSETSDHAYDAKHYLTTALNTIHPTLLADSLDTADALRFAQVYAQLATLEAIHQHTMALNEWCNHIVDQLNSLGDQINIIANQVTPDTPGGTFHGES